MAEQAETGYTVTTVGGIRTVPPRDWNACVGGVEPFTRHGFLAALEDSGSAVAATGWAPSHVVAYDPAGGVAGVAPAYIKTHSFGEFVFDWGWADAFERAGGRYYPKLQVQVPYTPVTGPRLAVHPGVSDPAAVRMALAEGLTGLCREHGLSSAHATFLTETERDFLSAAGWLQRMSHQYHWHNAGYRDFEDFLATLSADKRKQIRRERRAVARSGVTIHRLPGSELTAAHLDAFYTAYTATSAGKMGLAYLSRGFFDEVVQALGDDVLLVLCAFDGDWIAGAINFRGGDALYGRNWGCLPGTRDEVPFLHFEACYYQAIEAAIANGLARVEAGVQGEHKLKRGYVPVPTYSAHWIAHPGLSEAVADFLARERDLVAEAMAVLGEHTPYRRV